jgi:hypothetical protein
MTLSHEEQQKNFERQKLVNLRAPYLLVYHRAEDEIRQILQHQFHGVRYKENEILGYLELTYLDAINDVVKEDESFEVNFQLIFEKYQEACRNSFDATMQLIDFRPIFTELQSCFQKVVREREAKEREFDAEVDGGEFSRVVAFSPRKK